MFTDYYKTSREYDKENRRRQEEAGGQPKGLKNLNTTEKIYIAVIVLGLIGIFIRYVIF